jgi:hypothetical protein
MQVHFISEVPCIPSKSVSSEGSKYMHFGQILMQADLTEPHYVFSVHTETSKQATDIYFLLE